MNSDIIYKWAMVYALVLMAAVLAGAAIFIPWWPAQVLFSLIVPLPLGVIALVLRD